MFVIVACFNDSMSGFSSVQPNVSNVFGPFNTK